MTVSPLRIYGNFLDLILPKKQQGAAPHDLLRDKTLKEHPRSTVISAAKVTLLKETALQEQAETLFTRWLAKR